VREVQAGPREKVRNADTQNVAEQCRGRNVSKHQRRRGRRPALAARSASTRQPQPPTCSGRSEGSGGGAARGEQRAPRALDGGHRGARAGSGGGARGSGAERVLVRRRRRSTLRCGGAEEGDAGGSIPSPGGAREPSGVRHSGRMWARTLATGSRYPGGLAYSGGS
jgi:hypothetical protein